MGWGGVGEHGWVDGERFRVPICGRCPCRCCIRSSAVHAVRRRACAHAPPPAKDVQAWAAHGHHHAAVPPSPTHPDQAVLGLELLCCLQVIVDQAEAGALAATELSASAAEGVGVAIVSARCSDLGKTTVAGGGGALMLRSTDPAAPGALPTTDMRCASSRLLLLAAATPAPPKAACCCW